MQLTDKNIIKITMPVLVSLLMEHMISLTDTAYLGRVGEVELGASALAGVYYLVIYMLGFGFSLGAQVLMARRNGEGEYRRIGEIFTQGTFFLLIFAAILFVSSRVLSPIILKGIIESPDVYRATLDYLDWRVYGFFFSFIALMFRAFYVATTKTKTLTANSIVMVGTNVILNYILIFGKFGIPALGIKGAAIASAISEAVSVIFFIVYTYKRVDYRKYDMFVFGRANWRELKQILSVSVWVMIQNGLSFLSWLVFFIAIEHHGERPLAVTNIIRSISGFMFMFVNAFASTGSSLVSNLIGEGRTDDVLPLCRKMIRLCYMFVVPIALLFAFFPSMVLRIYTDSLDLIEASVPSLIVMLTSYALAVPAFIYFFCVSGTGNTRTALRLEMMSLAVYVVYTYYVAYYLKADVAVCWTTDHVYYLMVFSSYIYMLKGNWRNKRI